MNIQKYQLYVNEKQNTKTNKDCNKQIIKIRGNGIR